MKEAYVKKIANYHKSCGFSWSLNTWRVYLRGWENFESFCQERCYECLPAKPNTIIEWLNIACVNLSKSTIKSYLTAIKHRHEKCGLKSEVGNINVRKALHNLYYL